jgi:regulator of RNase E activity RraA
VGQRPADHDPLVAEIGGLAAASLSDAVDQVTGKRGFLSHEIRRMTPGKLFGRAVTVLAKPTPTGERAPPTLALEAIDEAERGSVLVIVMEGPGGADVAAVGGIMGTGCVERGIAGAVLDAGVRDVAELAELGLPVFARGAVPSTSVGRYLTVAKGVPVVCGGVEVRPGDIVAGDGDGVVVVPAERAEEVLKVARELDEREAKTMRSVRELKSVKKAIELHRRI